MAMSEILHSQDGPHKVVDSVLVEPSGPYARREAGGAEMSVVEHLEELRRRLFVCVLAIGIGALATFLCYGPLLQFLLRPLPSQANALVTHNGTPGQKVSRTLLTPPVLPTLSRRPVRILQHHPISVWIFERLALFVPIRVECLDRFIPTAL